jgi:hypothetical protein
MQMEGMEVITMNQQTQAQGRQQLREIIGGIFDHVLRKEKENAILNANRMETKIQQCGIQNPDRQS